MRINYEKLSNILISITCALIILWMILSILSCNNEKYEGKAWKQTSYKNDK